MKAKSTPTMAPAEQHRPFDVNVHPLEASMARAAVGLFENSGLANEIVRDLQAGSPQNADGSGMMSTPHIDFEVDLVRN